MKKKKSACLPDKILVRSFLGDFKDDKKAKIADHIFSCLECWTKFKTLNSLTWELKQKEKELPAEALTAAEVREFRKAARSRLHEMRKGPKQPAPISFARRLILIVATSLAVVMVCLCFLLCFK